ncbi:MAG: hypothetical protein KAS01_01200 [Candidatus Pacebacteria bacterium]|nr:hypothetical protein [Candidatus Paceibacterota bacterium]
MSQLTDREKISKIKELFAKFHVKIADLRKRQINLLNRALKMKQEKELKEVRKEIDEMK